MSDDYSGAIEPGDPELLEPTAAATAWTPAQIARLKDEWKRLQRLFAFHPNLRVIDLRGDPPDDYQVEYRVRTLIVDQSGQLAYSESCSVHIWLPPGFPKQAPVVRPLAAVFHPNVTLDTILLLPSWSPSLTLADVVSSVGRMLAFQIYDQNSPWNEAALEYVQMNPQIVPTDGRDMTSTAAGDPLDRICRAGAQTLHRIREQLIQTCDGLAGRQPPAPANVQHLCAKARQAMSLFLAEDIPETLRTLARELDEMARDMGGSLNKWEAFRRQHATAMRVVEAVKDLARTREGVANEVRIIENLVKVAPDAKPEDALKLVPEVSKIQTHHQKLASLIPLAIQAAAQVQSRLTAFESIPAVPVNEKGILGQRLEEQRTRGTQSAEDARKTVAEEVAKAKPVIASAQAWILGLRRMAGWREYVDVKQKAWELAKRIQEWGAAGVEGYFVENESGRFGPFQFEATLTLGAEQLAVRNVEPTSIEVLDAESGEVRARSDVGLAAALVADADSGESFATSFVLTGRGDELSVQLSYLANQANSILNKLLEKGEAGEGWAMTINHMLNTPEARERLVALQQESQLSWRAICDDLVTLHRFKQRLATHYLLKRISEAAPKMKASFAAAKKDLMEITERLQVIIQASTRMDDGSMQIASKFAKEYPAKLERREEAKQEIPRLEKRMARSAAEIRRRIESQELLGSYQIPETKSLGTLPEDIVRLQPELSADQLREHLDSLGALLRTEFDMVAPLGEEPVAESPTYGEQPTGYVHAAESSDEVAGFEAHSPASVPAEEHAPTSDEVTPAPEHVESEVAHSEDVVGDDFFHEEVGEEHEQDVMVDFFGDHPDKGDGKK